MPLTDLPSDLFLTILSYLTPHEVGRLSQVCVLLQQESTREGVWRGFSRTLIQRYYPDGLALYEEDKQACWRARSERRRLRFQSSRASALATIQRWGEAGSSSGGGGSSGSGSGSGGGSPGSAWEESAAAVTLESCSDSELDELDERERAAYAARLLAAGIAVQEAECSAPPSATAAAARQASPTLAALALRQRRRQLRAQRQASAARAAALRLAALEDFQATRQRRAGGSYRLAFPSLPLVRAAHPGAPPAEVGVYAMRCWYIRNGVQSTFHPVPDSVLKCVYHRALLLRADGSALYASTPGELPEALRHFARALRRAEGGGAAAAAAAAAQGPAATLAEWGPAPEGVPGMGRPVAHGELASSVCRGPEEGGVSRAAAAAAAAAAAEAAGAGAGAGGGAGAAAAPVPPSRKPRAERGDHTLGRGVWRQEGRRVEVCYVTGGHNILTRLQLALSSEEVGEGEEEGQGGGGGGGSSNTSSRAVFAQWSNTLTVEQMLVGSIGSEEGTVMNLRGERFYHYPLTAGVQALP